MARFITTRRIDAPQAAVFEVFSDLDQAAERLSGVVRLERLTDGPVGEGTRFRETRMMFKREATEEMEITAFDPPRRYTVGCTSCGCVYSTTFRFVPDGNGTNVEVEMETRPVKLMAKLTAPLMGRFLAKTVQKCFDQDLEELKRVVEGRSAIPQADQAGAVAARG